MQILERERAGQLPGLSQVDFLANLIVLSSRIPGFDWRDARVQDYGEYLKVTARETIIQEITCLLRGEPLGVTKTLYPQHKLEKLFGFQQFTIWSLMGSLGLKELRPILEQAFPAIARVTFKTNSPSVPEIWHAHVLAKVQPRQPRIPANTLIWTGSQPHQGQVHLQLS